MRYCGIHPTSEAKQYKDIRFAYTRNGVDYYECWAHDDEMRPTFGENLNVEKTRHIDEIVRNPDSFWNWDE